MEINSKLQLANIFSEIFRTLQHNGIFIFVVTTSQFYKYNWLTISTAYHENQELKSGHKVKLLLTDVGLEISDYFWSETDYVNLTQDSGFKILAKKYPLGSHDDGYPWLNELNHAPFVQYVLQKP
jgi:hypothetical protein